ncbi:carbohydrate kinase family protein [Oceanobacillus salinisoli]|uniref:carbohydrate kinase family protein n=1 Tax=Oceanobacillus salinisoli TaxID=2678611 RepID=UPI0012E1F700|nr:carbohydrate kinase family protein [Oceanobacillus salinisoli]
MIEITHDNKFSSDFILDEFGDTSSISKKKEETKLEKPKSSSDKTVVEIAEGKNLSQNTNEKQPIICIGGATIDRKFYAKQAIMSGTSNPVNSSTTVGGVARNIAENLGRLENEVTFISTVGDDSDWIEIDQVSSPFLNLEHVTKLEHAATGSYTAVLDPHGNLEIALADMDVFDEITPELLRTKRDILKQAKCIIVDLNCPRESVEFLSQFTMEHTIPLVVIPVSSPKMDRLPNSLEAVNWLIVNKDETETFLGMKITNMEDWKQSVEGWQKLGAKNVIVTHGAEGVVLGDENGTFRHYPAIATPEVVDVTGAGDAFCSAVVHSWLKKKDIDYIIRSGLVNSHKTITSKHTVRKELSENQIKSDMEAIFDGKIS